MWTGVRLTDQKPPIEFADEHDALNVGIRFAESLERGHHHVGGIDGHFWRDEAHILRAVRADHDVSSGL